MSRWRIAGLMSGTSADGVDAALIEVEATNAPLRPAVSILAHVTAPFPDDLRARLFRLFDADTARVDEITEMNALLGVVYADAVRTVAQAAGVPLSQIDLIGSHGQTIHHLPPRPPERRRGSTLQIGDPAVIAEETGIDVISHFRGRDMAAGGQGAPLVPYPDWILFGKAGSLRAVQNIGGIGNVTVLPASDRLGEVLAFDTGPGNMVIDALVRLATDGKSHADWDGKIAAQGSADPVWVADLMNDPFFRQPPPKSTGREAYGEAFSRRLWEKGREAGMGAADLIATATLWTARSIAEQYRRWIPQARSAAGPPLEVVVAGGGARNPILMRMLKEELAPASVRVSDELGVPADAREAAAFALLAWAALRGIPGNVPEATGSKGPRPLGSFTPAQSRPLQDPACKPL